MNCEGYGELGHEGHFCRRGVVHFWTFLELPHSNIFQKLFNFNIHNTHNAPQSLFYQQHQIFLTKHEIVYICLFIYILDTKHKQERYHIRLQIFKGQN